MKKLTYEEAIEIIQKSKRLTGEQSEQINRLANALLDGRWNLERDRQKAITLYRMAAEKGSRTAEFNLGVCYDKGEGVEQNDELAVEWYLSYCCAMKRHHHQSNCYERKHLTGGLLIVLDI